ncbi:hypothetical protein KFL_006930010 [Klebsormidium nitens]|uniref:Uncharacterized protein n=1 Tax=Klebsormidium nitens TaxID=105231 RepID=A0A1Y1IJH1_KLENI|nr:hypothetical protein KFL_006930010 [Klebsormidium nitens]|eukprot:GAQ90853.1 hypothetical protein KFL_006930010 [Klebsormidium nitens]
MRQKRGARKGCKGMVRQKSQKRGAQKGVQKERIKGARKRGVQKGARKKDAPKKGRAKRGAHIKKHVERGCAETGRAKGVRHEKKIRISEEPQKEGHCLKSPRRRPPPIRYTVSEK